MHVPYLVINAAYCSLCLAAPFLSRLVADTGGFFSAEQPRICFVFMRQGEEYHQQMLSGDNLFGFL
jgi:hypothetical protein